MKYISLIDQYVAIFGSLQLDEIEKILADDYYFRNPQIEIFGKADFMAYARENFISISTEAINLNIISETEFIHEYYLSFLNSSGQVQDRVHVTDRVKINNHQIISSVMEYKTDFVSATTKTIISKSVNVHGLQREQSHMRLVKYYIDIFATSQLDDLHDVLAVDFYFKNPKLEINGKSNYVDYVKNNTGVFNSETINLTAESPELYIHEYVLTMFDDDGFSRNSVLVCERIVVKNNLISSSVINYSMDSMPSHVQNSFDEVMNKFTA